MNNKTPLIVFTVAALVSSSIGITPLNASSDQFLDTCLQVAQARDKKLAVAQEQLNLAKTRVMRSGRGFFPYLMLQRRYSRGRTFDFTDVLAGTKVAEEFQSEELGLKAVQTIFEGGRLMATYKYDVLTEESARYSYTKVREELHYRVKLAYYEYLSLKMEYTALRKAFAEIDELMKKIRIEYNAKAIAELELVEAQNFRDKLENLLKAAELNLDLANKRLTALANTSSLDSLPVVMPDKLPEDVPEINFTLKDCEGFVRLNNVDLKLNQLQILMAEQKKYVVRSKSVPKIYAEGFYGQSGEAFVTEPLEPATVWSLTGRMSWTLWGNTAEVSYARDKTNPNAVIDPSSRTDNSTYELKVSLLDDFNSFVESKESKVSHQQAIAEYDEAMKKGLLDLAKAYNDYDSSRRNARTFKDEISLKQRKLTLMRKRNSLYEIPTVQVMEESWKYAETISSYARALYTNYSAVTEMERMTLVTLR